MTDPQTGQPVQQILQTQMNPVTGEAQQVMLPLNQNGSSPVQVVTVQDPVTGEMKQQIIDTNTGIPMQMSSNPGTPANTKIESEF